MRELSWTVLCLFFIVHCNGTETTNPADGHFDAGVHEPSGSPAGYTVPCPCNAQGHFIRVTVLAQEGENVTLRVEELIRAELDLAPGHEVEARFVGRLPCFRGTTQVVPGQEALAIFDSGEMVTPDRWAGVRLTPWTADLLFAQTDEAELFVPADELDQLWNNDDCRSDYGDWADLPGEAPDGDSDVYWCVEGGEEYRCADPDDDGLEGGGEPACPPLPDDAGGFDCCAGLLQVDGLIADVVSVAVHTSSCSTDSDCVRISTNSACSLNCGAVVPAPRQPDVEAAIREAGLICADVVEHGCQLPSDILCEEPAPPTCDHGVCK